jgi:hypothetical protein
MNVEGIEPFQERKRRITDGEIATSIDITV